MKFQGVNIHNQFRNYLCSKSTLRLSYHLTEGVTHKTGPIDLIRMALKRLRSIFRLLFMILIGTQLSGCESFVRGFDKMAGNTPSEDKLRNGSTSAYNLNLCHLGPSPLVLIQHRDSIQKLSGQRASAQKFSGQRVSGRTSNWSDGKPPHLSRIESLKYNRLQESFSKSQDSGQDKEQTEDLNQKPNRLLKTDRRIANLSEPDMVKFFLENALNHPHLYGLNDNYFAFTIDKRNPKRTNVFFTPSSEDPAKQGLSFILTLRKAFRLNRAQRVQMFEETKKFLKSPLRISEGFEEFLKLNRKQVESNHLKIYRRGNQWIQSGETIPRYQIAKLIGESLLKKYSENQSIDLNSQLKKVPDLRIQTKCTSSIIVSNSTSENLNQDLIKDSDANNNEAISQRNFNKRNTNKMTINDLRLHGAPIALKTANRLILLIAHKSLYAKNRQVPNKPLKALVSKSPYFYSSLPSEMGTVCAQQTAKQSNAQEASIDSPSNWLFSFSGEAHREYLINLFRYQTEELSNYDQIRLMIEFPRHRIISDPLRIQFESRRAGPEHTDKILTLPIPVYSEAKLGHILAVSTHDSKRALIGLDDRHPYDYFCF